MFRLFIRTSLMGFSIAALLLGGAMTASGAFRPVRFFVAGSNNFTISNDPLYAVFETGEVYPLPHSDEPTINIQVGQKRFFWLKRNFELVVWKEWESQIRGNSFFWDGSESRWLSEGQVAWVQRQTQNSSLKGVGVWKNGQETIQINRNAEEITKLTWIGENHLWWLERAPASRHWRVMQWDGHNTTIILENMPTSRAHDIKFIGCGAYWFRQNNADARIEIWNGRMIDIPVDTDKPIVRIISQDCQRFILFNTSEQFIWDGMQIYRFPFQHIQPLDNDTFFGAEALAPGGDWTLNRWRDGEILQSVIVPQTYHLGNPLFVAKLQDSQTIFVTISNGNLYRWDLATNQLHSITQGYKLRYAFGDLGYQLLGTETNPQLIWCGGPTGQMSNTVYHWHSETDRISVVQTNALCRTRVMSDGSLIGLTQPNSTEPPVFFRWDGQTSHLFPRNDHIGTSTYIYSDWMTLQ